MLKPVTNRGIVWEYLHSIWILWVIVIGFFGFFNWPAFFYVAFRARNKKWAILGAVYLAPFVIAIVISSVQGSNSPITGLWVLLLFASWVASIVHAFLIRREYLVRLDVHQRAQVLRAERADEKYRHLREEVTRQSGLAALSSPPLRAAGNSVGFMASEPAALSNTTLPAMLPPVPVAPSTPLQPRSSTPVNTSFSPSTTLQPLSAPVSPSLPLQPGMEVVDVNSASEATLAQLPGVGVILAKQALAQREAQGGFKSVDEFGAALQLKPHILERIRPLVVVSTPSTTPQPHSRPLGRRIDF